MLYKSLLNIAIIAFILTTVTTVFASSTTPNDMTCKEFLDLNPKSMTPVAFWVMNEDTQYKKGDYVDFNETDTVYTPKFIDICKKSPDKKISDMKKDVMTAAK
ncbi:acid-activated periplasmic chaperone HdeB [Yersinia proxima]|uniref:Acid stress chaperone HdeB n=1 Tax=Yersinia proxima TaxID=2890316 RepID=A0ABW9ETL6_9GAMM|nr:acid-activated periplasmic chaperone HdeB [Yersinia proxima]CNL44117.1 acid-resistance protein [Yersinia intermedia]